MSIKMRGIMGRRVTRPAPTENKMPRSLFSNAALPFRGSRGRSPSTQMETLEKSFDVGQSRLDWPRKWFNTSAAFWSGGKIG
jgi:hypothetical protein